MLSDKSLKLIDIELAKYPKEQSRSAIMASLRIAQSELGWLSTDTMEFVANYINIPATQAMEVATFYGMYNLKEVGTHKISVCTNLPCALSGGMDTFEYVCQKLGLDTDKGGTTLDKKFTVQQYECMGACGDAPVILINNHKMCGSMNKEEVDKKLAEFA